MILKDAGKSVLQVVCLTTLSYIGGAQIIADHARGPGKCDVSDGCDAFSFTGRECLLLTDTRTCGHDISILFGNIRVNDPLCEAAKASQNAIYSSLKLDCEGRKASEQAVFEVRKALCSAMAQAACESLRAQPGASIVNGASILWVDDSQDEINYERHVFTRLGAKISLASGVNDALARLRGGVEKFDAIIVNLQRSVDPLARYTLLAAVLKLPKHPPYIIYSSSSGPASVAEAKRKGAFGEAGDAKELLELALKAIKKNASSR